MWSDGPFDVVWHHLLEIDPDEMVEAREYQKMQLARYAKQSLRELGEADVVQIREWIRLLDKLLSAEHEFQRALED